MAIIYSYNTITPQMGDKVLGSNLVDANGAKVTGNPTVQYSFTDIKTLVDQQFIQQFTVSSNAVSQEPGGTNSIHQIEFGPANSTSTSVTIDVNGKVVFLKTGTYYITQEYYLSGTQGNKLQTLFRTLRTIPGSSATQFGATHVELFTVQESSDRKRVVINQMLNVTVGNTECVYQMVRDSAGADDGTLIQISNNNSFTATPNAQLTISKLI
tara:strand:+ start:1798 stop:2433 length:636 start_codon:yes stop_codon:yes gene_type:complete